MIVTTEQMYNALERDGLVVYALLEKNVNSYVHIFQVDMPLLVKGFQINHSEEKYGEEQIKRLSLSKDEIVYNCEYCISIYFSFTFVTG